MSQAMQTQASFDDNQEQFWNLWGWLLSGVWIVFLIFPILDLVNKPYPVTVRIVGFILLAVFAVTYLRGYAKYSSVVGFGGTREWPAQARFLVLTGIALLALPVTGLSALGLIPFVTSYAAFLLTRRWTQVTYAVATVTVIALPLALGRFVDALFLVGLNLVMMVVYAITVAAITRAATAEELRGDYLVLAEQERVARDVHDGIGHSLTALNLKAQLAMKLMDAERYEQARAEVQQLSELAVNALDSVRTTVHGLNRQDLDAELVQLRVACKDNDLSFTVIGNAQQVPLRWRSHTAWIMREAVTNVLRHAHASMVRISISSSEVSVEDDGDGLGASDAGHGIRGMQERANQIDATAKVGASELGGTCVTLTFASQSKGAA
ncbi:sensor histidine kinase [Glutamicibacter sp. JC586]|uniref:sensor histidine kinase n=1 Tax=Glutamicibacter sp. JC586 TaxID=2590552 RepID=UPI0013587204|nr:histidine kinase [Glutamicibacter sp. JC586]